MPAPLRNIFFLVQVTSKTGTGTAAQYQFVEHWITTPGAATSTKVGGRYSDAANVGYCVTGELSVGDYALARLGEGMGGVNWELVPVDPGSSPSSCTGCGWIAGLRADDCLKVSVVSATGACACGADTESIYLTSTDGETWTGAAGLASGSGGCDSLPTDGGAYQISATGTCGHATTAITSVGTNEWATSGGWVGGYDAHVAWDSGTGDWSAWFDTTPELYGTLVSARCDFVAPDGTHWADVTFDFTATGGLPCTGTMRITFYWSLP